ERIDVGAYFRNAGTEQLKLTPPVQLDAELVTPQSRMFVALSRKGEWTSDKTIAPGESLFVEYELELPPEASGRVVLELNRIAAARGGIEMEPRGSLGPTEPEQPSEHTVSPPPGGFRYAEASLQRFHAYEPMYFVAGTSRPNVRFQFSFQYQIFNPEGPWAS